MTTDPTTSIPAPSVAAVLAMVGTLTTTDVQQVYVKVGTLLEKRRKQAREKAWAESDKRQAKMVIDSSKERT